MTTVIVCGIDEMLDLNPSMDGTITRLVLLLPVHYAAYLFG